MGKIDRLILKNQKTVSLCCEIHSGISIFSSTTIVLILIVKLLIFFPDKCSSRSLSSVGAIMNKGRKNMQNCTVQCYIDLRLQEEVFRVEEKLSRFIAIKDDSCESL